MTKIHHFKTNLFKISKFLTFFNNFDTLDILSKFDQFFKNKPKLDKNNTKF